MLKIGDASPRGRAPYYMYAQPFVADSGGTSSVATTIIESRGPEHHAADAAYEGGSLAGLGLLFGL